MGLKTLGAVVAFMVVCSTHADQLTADQAEIVAGRYARATLGHDFAQAVEDVHPAALARIARLMERSYRGEQDLPEFRRMFGVDSLESLRNLPHRVIWVCVMSDQTRQDVELQEMLQNAHVEVLGTTHEAEGPGGTELMHVLYRIELNDVAARDNHIAVVTLKPHGGEWKALFSKEFKITLM